MIRTGSRAPIAPRITKLTPTKIISDQLISIGTAFGITSPVMKVTTKLIPTPTTISNTASAKVALINVVTGIPCARKTAYSGNFCIVKIYKKTAMTINEMTIKNPIITW